MEIGSVSSWANWALSLIAMVIATLAAKSSRNRAELDTVKSRLDAFERQLAVIAGEMKHLPDAGDVHELKLSLAELRTEVRVIVAGVQPIKGLVDMLSQAALEKKKS